MEIVIVALLWFATVSVGIMAGIYFAFSVFVMQSLDALDRPAGMMAMQSINRIIQKSLFLPLFFLSSLACLLIAVMGVMHWGGPGVWQMITGGMLYVMGMLIVTIVGNVPLNNALEATAVDGPEAETMWRHYMRRWLPWNHVRTVSCTASLILLIGALAER